MNLNKLKNLILLALFTLTLFITPTKIKANLPAIKGLYELFTPDVIGIGQALKTKGWIENVYDFAPAGDTKKNIQGNLAKNVIETFWHKISENELLKPTELAPVSEITPEILGRIINYIRKYKDGDDTERERIAKDWYNACQDYITNKLPEKVKIDINKIIELITKENTINKNKLATKQPENTLTNSRNTLNSEISKLKDSIKSLKKDKKTTEAETKKSELTKKEAALAKIYTELAEIKNLTKAIKDYPDKLNKIQAKLVKESLDKEIEIKRAKIEAYTIEIIKDIEKLAASQDFIPGTTEAILWAFFEDKFTTKDTKEAQTNLDLCLKQITENINKEKYNKKVLYELKEYKTFKQEIDNIKKEDKITKIIENYDRSTYSSITEANIKIVPPVVNSPIISFELSETKKTKPFATCFESAILDTLNILLYNPKNKAYDLELLTKDITLGKFFDNIIKSVFTDIEKNKEQDLKEDLLIDPKNINTKFQNWINIIENKKEYAIEYHDHAQIDGENVGYNLNTRIENLIKILNEIFNLGLEIQYNQVDPKILEINNFDKIIQKPKDAQDFWNKIFELVSKKLSTENRTINFSCQLDPNSSINPIFEASENKIKISDSIGKISIIINYNDYEYQQFDTSFDLNIQSGHAFVTAKERDTLGLNYSSDFKTLVAEKVYADNTQKLLPLFILLLNLEMLEKTDIKMQNLLFYCMPLKSDENKLDFMKIISTEGLFEDQSFRPLIKQFIDKILTNENLGEELLDYAIKEKIENEIKNEIFQSAIEKNSINSLPKLINDAAINEKLEKFIEEKVKNMDNVSFNTPYDCTILSLAQKKGFKKIIAAILKNPNTKNFDKLIYYINEIPKLTKDTEKKAAYNEAIKLINYQSTDINGPGDKFKTPLHIAIEKNNIELFKALLTNKKIDINKQEGYEYKTPLVYALYLNNINPNENIIQLVEALLNHKNENGQYDINIEIKDRSNLTAIDIAKEEIKKLLEDINKKRKNEKIKLELLAQAESDDKKTLILALNKIINFEITKIDKELQDAAIKMILKPDLEISTPCEERTILSVARINKHEGIINAILNHPKIKNFDKLNYYIMTGDNKKIDELLNDPKTEINGPQEECLTPLYYAVFKRNIDIVEKILKNKDLNINKVINSKKRTILHIMACSGYGNPEILELILKDPRTKINQRDLDNNTPLDNIKNYNGTYSDEYEEILKKYGAKEGISHSFDSEGEIIPIEGEDPIK